MEHRAIEEVEHVEHPTHVNEVRKPVSRALGATGFAMVYNELAPGDSFGGALHTHHDVEEVFYIVEGTATFEVGKERETVEVGPGELIRFAPGEFQRGYNWSDDRVVGFIFSAPGAEHDWAEEELFFECRSCGEERVHGIETIEDSSWQVGTVEFRLRCKSCGNTFTSGGNAE